MSTFSVSRYENGPSSRTQSISSRQFGAASSGVVNQVASDLLLSQAGGSSSGSFGVSSGFGSSGLSSSGSAAYGGSSSISLGGGSAQYSSGLSSSGSAAYGGSSSISLGGGSAQYSSGSASLSVSGGGAATFLSEIESAILRSQVPIEINETEEITINGQRGIWANRAEVAQWRGVIPITEYLINEDANPEVITKRSTQNLVYIQELAIRYLRPPTPPAPGEIVITQELNTLVPPAPPLVIRQQPARANTPEPLVIREAPPQAPAAVGRKVITISGKRIPPPPRKVIIERLAPLPSKPQSVLVERWLPYSQVKRRVIFQRSNERDAVVVKPRNVIVQWEAPQVQIKKEFKYLGVVRANPAEYVQRYGASLKIARDLPQFVLDIKTPDDLVLAADSKAQGLYELEGDLEALKLVDLDREGLSEYREYLQRLGIRYQGGAVSSAGFAGSNISSGLGAVSSSRITASSQMVSSSGSSQMLSGGGVSQISLSGGAAVGGSVTRSMASVSGGNLNAIIEEIFKQYSHNNRITQVDAQTLLLRLNSRLGRRYGEDDVKAFYNVLDVDHDGSIDLEEFKRAFTTLINA